MLFGFSWVWQESCGVCPAFIIAGSPDFPQYSEWEPEVWLAGTFPTCVLGLCVAFLALDRWARGPLQVMPALGAQLLSWARDLHRPCWSGKPFPPQPLPLLISLPERRATVQGLATKLSTWVNALRWSPSASLPGRHPSFPSFERVPKRVSSCQQPVRAQTSCGR